MIDDIIVLLLMLHGPVDAQNRKYLGRGWSRYPYEKKNRKYIKNGKDRKRFVFTRIL